MKLTKRYIAALTKRAGEVDGWRDFAGMLNPALAEKLDTGEMYLPNLDSEYKSKEAASKPLLPIVLGRMLRKSYPMKVQNWYIAGSKFTENDKLESLFAHTDDQKMIDEGAASEDVNVRRGVAANPVTPISVLSALSFDLEPSVRLAVLQNGRTPVSDVEYLSLDKIDKVKNFARQKLARIMSEEYVLSKFPAQ